MSFVELIAISIGLAMDAFAVSLGIGTSRQTRTRRSAVRLAFHLGLFQSLMTLLGWLGGFYVARYIEAIDHWVAMGLLAFVGVRMIRSGLDPHSESYPADPSRGRLLVILSVACSIDAMAVGLSLAVMLVNITWASLVIGLVTFGFSLLGLFGGNKLSEKFGKRMEIVGGVILLGIGLRILITHLL